MNEGVGVTLSKSLLKEKKREKEAKSTVAKKDSIYAGMDGCHVRASRAERYTIVHVGWGFRSVPKESIMSMGIQENEKRSCRGDRKT